jgi:TPR repeat protein
MTTFPGTAQKIPTGDLLLAPRLTKVLLLPRRKPNALQLGISGVSPSMFLVGALAQAGNIKMPSDFQKGVVHYHHGDEILACSRFDCLPEVRSKLDQARSSISNQRFLEAKSLLEPLVDDGNPEAEYLLSGFWFDEETEPAYVQRCLRMLESSASKSYAPAIYELGVAYDTGDMVDVDKSKAALLFAAAADLGHVKAEWIHGTALLHGANGVERNISRGLSMIESSASGLFRGALITLAGFYERGDFGLPVDMEASRKMRTLAESDAAIDY